MNGGARRFADRAYNRLHRATDPALALAQKIRNSGRWKRVRAAYRLEHPMCELCRKAGRLEPARQVDHIVPLEIAPELAFEWTNLQALCTPCHALKSQEERKPKGENEMSAENKVDPPKDPPEGLEPAVAWTPDRPSPAVGFDWAHLKMRQALTGDAPHEWVEAAAAVLRLERAARFSTPLRVLEGTKIIRLQPNPGDVIVFQLPESVTPELLAHAQATAAAWWALSPVIAVEPPVTVRVEAGARAPAP